MKKIIKYFYNLNPEKIYNKKNIYRFSANKKNYIFHEYKNENVEIEEKYKLQMYLEKLKIICNCIIKNNMNEIITKINEKKYILIELRIKTRRINIMDLLLLTNIKIENILIKKIDRTDWKKMWKKNIDYIEYQIYTNNIKNRYIKESNQYYIGITENCISMLENIEPIEYNKTICHERVDHKMTTDEFYNPLNFIVDNRIRDYGEFIKGYLYSQPSESEIIKGITKEILTKANLLKKEFIMLYIRILYPGKYFDIYEKLIKKEDEEKELLKLISNSLEIEKNLKIIYSIINKKQYIPNIDWIK